MKDNLLKEWRILRLPDGEHVVVGKIYHDAKERFADGTQICTSALREINFACGYADTMNTRYTLGRMASDGT